MTLHPLVQCQELLFVWNGFVVPMAKCSGVKRKIEIDEVLKVFHNRGIRGSGF